MKVLVTGGAGYLGSVLVRKLLLSGHQVRVIDSLLFGDQSTRVLFHNESFELVEADIRDTQALSKAMYKVKAVIHLAAIVGDQAANIDPQVSFETNSLATKTLAEFSRLQGVEKFVFASTCSVYGGQPGKVLTEKSKTKPVSLYGKTKYESEQVLMAIDDFSPTIFRMGTLYGLSYRMRFDLLVNLFTAQAFKENKITVFGGNQNRPFIHVDDAADAFVSCLENKCHGLFNLGGENISINEVAQTVKDCIPSVKVEIKPETKDKRDYKISNSKIEKTLTFKNKKNVKQGITEIRNAFARGDFGDYPSPRYSNYGFQ